MTWTWRTLPRSSSSRMRVGKPVSCEARRLAAVDPRYMHFFQPRKQQQAESGQNVDANFTSCLALREGKTTHSQPKAENQAMVIIISRCACPCASEKIMGACKPPAVAGSARNARSSNFERLRSHFPTLSTCTSGFPPSECIAKLASTIPMSPLPRETVCPTLEIASP